MSDPVRVLVVDDEPDIRLLVRGLLSSRTDVEIVGEAEDGASAVTTWRELQPDVIVLDLRMPDLDGLQVAEAILAEAPGVAIILLSAFLTDETREHAHSLGVRECLSKNEVFRLPEQLALLAS